MNNKDLPELVKEELANDLATIAVLIARKKNIDLNGFDEITFFLSDLATSLDTKLELSDEELQDEAVSSILDVLETAAAFTPTTIDDKIVSIAQNIYSFLDINRPFAAWIEKIKLRRKAKKAAKRAKKDAKNN